MTAIARIEAATDGPAMGPSMPEAPVPDMPVRGTRVRRRGAAATGAGGIPGLLRRAGLRPTRQRIALAGLLFSRGDRHVSAETVYDEALRARAGVSLATVYNTLNQFTEAGLLRELAVAGAKSFFDTRVGPHHHFYVEEDGAMIDVPAEAVEIARVPEVPEGMEIAGIEVVVRLRRRA